MAAIAIGIIMMVLAVSIGIGFQKKIREKMAVFNGHVVITHYDDNNSEVSKNPISINQDFYPKFNSVSGIKHIQAVANKIGVIRTETAVEGVNLKGVGLDYEWKGISEFITQGQVPKFSKSGVSTEIIISEYLAERLHLKLYDKCVTYFIKDDSQKYNTRVFTIAGIYNSSFQEFDNTVIIGDIRHIQRINKWNEDQIGAFEVFLDDFEQLDSKGLEIYEYTPSALNSYTIKEKYSFIFDWLLLLDTNIILIICIMILVATINMVVVLLVLILEKTAMIGILKAMGGNNWLIRKIFIWQALKIIAYGLFFGNLIALGIIFIQKKFEIIRLPPENYYVTVAPLDFNITHILLINFGTVFIALLVLLLPSYLITKISPVKAMKFD
jgi:lipoprotein-releasing system permease protein